MRTLFLGLAVIASALVAPACLDFSPTIVQANNGTDVDGSAPDGGARACDLCLAAADDPGPGCGSEFDACHANAKCSQAIDCAVAQGCFQGSSKELVSCGTPCAAQAGIQTLDDPAIPLASKVFNCMTATCTSHCFGSE